MRIGPILINFDALSEAFPHTVRHIQHDILAKATNSHFAINIEDNTDYHPENNDDVYVRIYYTNENGSDLSFKIGIPEKYVIYMDATQTEIQKMNSLIKEYLDDYIDENNVKLSDEQYLQAYKGVEFWLTTTLPDAVSDSLTNVL